MTSLAACCIVKNELPYLVEWIAFHLVAGVQTFVIYDNGSSDGTFELLSDLSSRAPIKLFSWPSVKGASPQITAYEHAIKTFKDEVDFIAFIDADEFLSTVSGNNLRDIIEGLASSVGAIAVNQTVFGSSWLKSYEPDLVTSRFVRRADLLHEESHYFKTIARASAVSYFSSVHSVVLNQGSYLYGNGGLVEVSQEHPGKSLDIKTGDLRLHHYILKSSEEYRAKMNRGAVGDHTLGNRRYDESFFSHRERYANEVEDRIFAERSCRVREMIREIHPKGAG